MCGMRHMTIWSERDCAQQPALRKGRTGWKGAGGQHGQRERHTTVAWRITPRRPPKHGWDRRIPKLKRTRSSMSDNVRAGA
eukprot:15476106-Alexandrium_andersonii.AAC.1